MDYLPVFLKLTGRLCLVVGGGAVALRKAEMLRRAGAEVGVIAPRFHPQLEALARRGEIRLRRQDYTPAALDGAVLVIAATDDGALNHRIATEARRRGIWINAVDQPDDCDFILPAIVDRSPVVVAVSSGGRAPVLTRQVKARLETLLPAGLGRLAHLAGRFRETVKRRLPPPRRRRFWEQVFDGAPGQLVHAGQEQAAAQALEQALTAAETDRPLPGYVALVGAGPGDPELLTLRALRLLQEADVVVYDRLVSQPILELVRRDAEKIYAGKARADHALPQEAINTLLVRLAKQGKRVVRLKGGDPFIFGRGGEEIATLADEGVPFIVVPGITAASGCASYAGIPLTHRDYAQSCLFVTGHRRDDRPNLDWNRLIAPRQTLVIYMGLLGLEEICQALVAHGMDPAMPAALIQAGTTPQQQVVVTTVATLADRARQTGVSPPTLVIVGEVVRLHDKLAWFQGNHR
ncbi:uroporphyrin-III C-methyltransferase/precorrin-2 dehydrogenase/sirohydrochlorin ferrochelatase [Methylomarinovum tepidoasis]|uniref:Siroheme synthase n=2 Tax=Methylomarinovum tepidoasis TaxID=2840183 RepID=A0AAU9CDX7_9GAMM|nr:siroheme synthase CysG [Methylomarinovum sp. IN45]BCX88996.1 uroporphyrin-III C-methyltransferase/precorrin-2 dehydrogenase/sirohydrochlorin ferrochelatase [Methylomarinovum sp. IN45]